ncbi:MAG: glycine--tRNA ligase subunit beta, partial [bacterium]
MGVHQRVFPLFVGDRLSNRFLVVSNHPNAQDPACAATIATGNARVLAARFHDAKFFYAEDRKRPLQAHGQKLAGMQWIRGAGTMAEKTARVGQIAEALAPVVGADPADAARAGALAKADLATQMVGEFPELQGHVGRLLAALDGEPGGVPLAIEEHYLPRFAGDGLPATPAGLAIALADRPDTLAHTFRLGLKPMGSAVPLGLRRAAGGLVALILGA